MFATNKAAITQSMSLPSQCPAGGRLRSGSEQGAELLTHLSPKNLLHALKPVSIKSLIISYQST